MKKTLFVRLLALVLTLAVVVAAALPVGAAYELPMETSTPDESIYLVDLDNGNVLLDKNSSESRYIASLTKMMTALLVLESGADMEKTLSVPDRLAQELKDIQNANGSGLGLQVGEEIKIRDLLYGVLVASANDATSVLADYLGGGSIPAFVDQMNQKAAALGCTATQFSCPHGLYDQGNVSTAQDLVKIATACWKNPQYMEIANTVQYTIPATNKHTLPRELEPTNLMLIPDGEYYRPDVSGVKTGFTTLAGRCYVTTATHEGHRYMLVILGAKKEKKNEKFFVYTEANALLDWLFSRYSDRTLVEKNQKVGEIPLRGCDESDVVTLHASKALTQHAYEDAVVEVKLDAEQEYKAPLEAGEKLGTAVITLDGKEVGRVDLITDKAYESAMLKGGLQAVLLVPVVLVLVVALAAFTARVSHSRVHFAVLVQHGAPGRRHMGALGARWQAFTRYWAKIGRRIHRLIQEKRANRR